MTKSMQQVMVNSIHIVEQHSCFAAMKIFSEAVPKMWCRDLVWSAIMEGRAHVICRAHGHEVHFHAPDVADIFRCYIKQAVDEDEGWYVNYHADTVNMTGPMKLRGMSHQILELIEAVGHKTTAAAQCVLLSCSTI